LYIERASISKEAVDAFLVIGRKTDLAPGPGGSRITPFPLDNSLKDVISSLGTDLRTMFVVLYPSSQLVGHKDPPLPSIRYHIPLIVNPGCWVFHDSSWQQLEVGHIYEMDQTKVHGAVNWGPDIRIHLIVDAK
jgi:hypothetical protein